MNAELMLIPFVYFVFMVDVRLKGRGSFDWHL